VVRQWADIAGSLLSHPFRSEVFVNNRILNWQTGDWVGSVGHLGSFLIQTDPVQFSPDGRLLVIASWNDVSVWRVADRALHYRLSFREPVRLCQVSPDGRLLAVAVQSYYSQDGEVLLYNLEDGSLRWRLFPVWYIEWGAIRFSADGTLLAIAPYSNETCLYRTADNTLQGVIADYGYTQSAVYALWGCERRWLRVGVRYL
jgi:WD40 repeat protein